MRSKLLSLASFLSAFGLLLFGLWSGLHVEHPEKKAIEELSALVINKTALATN